MRKMEHGGDWAGFQQEFGWEPLDFSANINPLGVPEGVCRAIARAAAKADRYPDPACRRLVHALAETEQVREDWILCGNGAAPETGAADGPGLFGIPLCPPKRGLPGGVHPAGGKE